jgi:hypothetical protein
VQELRSFSLFCGNGVKQIIIMKELAHKIFKELKDKLIIKSQSLSEIAGMPCVQFSYYDGMKTWSHKVYLAYEEKEVFLFSCRMLKKEELKDILYYKYNDHEEQYKTAIKTTEEAIDFLRKYDNFKLKF